MVKSIVEDDEILLGGDVYSPAQILRQWRRMDAAAFKRPEDNLHIGIIKSYKKWTIVRLRPESLLGDG